MVEPTNNTIGVDDLEDACLQCRSRREDQDLAVKSATRKIATLTAICSVLCVLTISACCCSLYFYTRFQGFRQELVALVRTDNEKADDLLDDHFPSDHNAMPMYGDPLDSYDDSEFESENTRGIRQRRKKEKKGKKKPRPKKCNKKKMRICDCCKQKLTDYIDAKIESESKRITKQEIPVLPSEATPTNQDEIAGQKRLTYVSAAHYTTYVDEKYINKQFGNLEHDFHNNPPQNENEDETENQESDEEMSVDIPEWQAAPLTLRFFKEADWMENSTTAKLFDFDKSTGKFTAKQTGLYHLYAHVLFYDVKTRMAIGLLHGNKKGMQRGSKGKESIVFRCMESVDYVNPQLKIGQNAKFKSCNVNGVLFLSQGDTIAIQSLYKHTCLDLTYDSTYFGAIYFSTPSS